MLFSRSALKMLSLWVLAFMCLSTTSRTFEGRKLTVSGSMFILDHDNVDGNETGTFALKTQNLFLNENAVQDLYTESHCVDKEVRGELDVDAQLLTNGDIKITGSIKLYEGASCSTNDLDGQHTFSFVVPRGQTKSWEHKQVNTDEGDDYIEVKMTFGNFDA